ncbi:Transcriptional regulator PadR-like family protein [compost metagenome]|jgi:DNA-binding PadR family transcriptional regulator|uniref:Helix-turn-helix transcriptional regulator n=1 Tax=Paenibacillus rhizolycopersici TaxID=2780073 RepID=A0ABS2H0F2_9BACL|nr:MULTISPECIES: helix-turn-helix transcriptional regulator [Paenibacillus]MBM6994775.1 helix-turn-helix transcriptional regulator [Paenibacillus rhizolycopersici]MUG87160.1 PadR family transcriptional regulator [Paenibacillus timonensis]GIP49119.1 PadR family transcriptional regulator [Paenibacillus sp. J53TS2]
MSRDNKHLPLTETVYYILLALAEPAHGYLIMQKVEELSRGQVRMAAGTLYGAIDNLVKLKWIEPVATADSRRKVYAITGQGREILWLDYERMNHMRNVTKEIMSWE